MTILAIVKLVLTFADRLMAYLNQSQLLEAGKAIETSANLKRAIDEVRCANDARGVVDRRRASDPNWMPDNDPNRID